MARYYLDVEFNGLGGELLSLSLVPHDDREPLYLVRSDLPPQIDPWVAEHVVPHLLVGPYDALSLGCWPKMIQDYLAGTEGPVVVTDWPDDVRYFCELLITGPGTMIDIPGVMFEVHRVDAYPTELPGAVQHNAYWDAMALRHRLRSAAPPSPWVPIEECGELVEGEYLIHFERGDVVRLLTWNGSVWHDDEAEYRSPTHIHRMGPITGLEER